MIRSVCEAILTDSSVSATIRERRAKGLLKLGEMYEREGKNALTQLKLKKHTIISKKNNTNNSNNTNTNVNTTNTNNMNNIPFDTIHDAFDLD
jgi:hypothetical protein